MAYTDRDEREKRKEKRKEKCVIERKRVKTGRGEINRSVLGGTSENIRVIVVVIIIRLKIKVWV